MKTLMLMRHAKSSWDNSLLSDYERPLNGRGRGDAPRMGRLLYNEDWLPDLIIASSARRAADTADLVALSAGYEGEIVYTDNLYHGDPEDYIAAAKAADDSVDSILMVGHNPGIEELVVDLSGHAERMPTAALAVFEVDIPSWQALSIDQDFRLVGIWLPKALP